MKRHTYSTDNDSRVKVIAGLGILSYLLGTWIANFLVWLVDVISSLANMEGQVGTFIDFLWSPLLQLGLRPEAWVPTTGLLFAVLFALFNQRWWKNRHVQAAPWITVPDLNGEWEVSIKQTQAAMAADGGGSQDADPQVRQRVVGSATIDQTWRHVLISMEFEESVSTSLGASFITDTTPLRLQYYYRNEPKPSAPEEAAVHYGATQLRYDEEADILEGDYFTDRFRQTSGGIVLERTATSTAG